MFLLYPKLNLETGNVYFIVYKWCKAEDASTIPCINTQYFPDYWCLCSLKLFL